jgi:hypothetical protein
MNNDICESKIIQEFQENLIAEAIESINNIIPTFCQQEQISDEKMNKVRDVVVKNIRPHIARCFEMLSNEDIILWNQLHTQMKSQRYKNIVQKITPIFMDNLQTSTNQIMKIIME